jgi:hypothetical protein
MTFASTRKKMRRILLPLLPLLLTSTLATAAAAPANAPHEATPESAALSTPISAPPSGRSDPEVLPEVTTKVAVSNRDVDRISCAGSVGDYFWSQEKPVDISASGNNLFVKFKIEHEGSKYVFTHEPVDVHIVCEEAVYTVVLVPEDIDSVTVRLQPGVSKALKHVVKEWGELPLESRIERLTLMMYHQEFPEGIQHLPIQGDDLRRTVSLTDRSGKPVNGVTIRCDYQVIAHGTGLQGQECEVVADHAVELNEGDFISRQFGNVVGVTLDPLKIEANQPARLFIIQRSVRDES